MTLLNIFECARYSLDLDAVYSGFSLFNSSFNVMTKLKVEFSRVGVVASNSLFSFDFENPQFLRYSLEHGPPSWCELLCLPFPVGVVRIIQNQSLGEVVYMIL